MSNWITLDQSQMIKRQDVEMNGVHVQVFVSPYDIPEAVRGELDKTNGRFEIEFRYLSADDALVRSDHESGTVCLFVGKNSGRLYRIVLDVKKLGIDRVGLSIMTQVEHVVDEAINKLVKTRLPRERNYSLAKEVISQRRRELFADLVAQ